MTRRHRQAALLAGACVLLLTAAGCSDLRSEIEAEQGGGAAPTAPERPPPPPSPLDLYPSGTPSPSAEANAPGCPPSGLDVVVGGENAAMGHRVITLKLWNCGDKPYRVKGHPGVELLDAGREPIDVKISHKSDYSYTGRRDDRARQLTLEPNDTADAVLHWNNRVTSVDGAPAAGAHVLVTPAPGEEPVSLPLAVDIGSDSTLEVTSWAVDPVSGR
ncbi:DUF4232 domain-containing protein [Streptomyces niveus]|uniref:DUF4232 domain-containing protein n=1 Tax=Streptomyces niveus TaxID=193462 RepID=UPI00365598AE